MMLNVGFVESCCFDSESAYLQGKKEIRVIQNIIFNASQKALFKRVYALLAKKAAAKFCNELSLNLSFLLAAQGSFAAL